MPRTLKGERDPLRLRFGGGLNTRGSEEDIDPRECAAGENFALDAGNLQYRPRRPFDLVGTVPNAGTIKGAASLLKSDGTVSTLIQADGAVYEWTAGPTFTQVGSVDSNSKIRGRLEQNWQLADKVLITDLALQDVVKEWDGTTFQNVTFTDENSASFGALRAKYCHVSNERAIFANVNDNGTVFAHLLVGSKRGDYTQISVSQRPSSALSAEDPWFLVQPDLYAVNGLIEAFGQHLISSNYGSIFKLAGSDATDFEMDELATRAGVAGDEAIAETGNDVLYARQGRIESAAATDKFGDVESNDLSFWIRDEIEDYGDWVLAHNRRFDRTYCHPAGESRLYVMHHAVLDSGQGQLSPWSKWTTQHALAFNPTLMMPVLSPIDGLEYILMGDASGNVYLMEGTASGGDGGSAAVKARRLSGLVSAAAEGKIHDMQGYIRYRKNRAVTVDMTFVYSGEHSMREAIQIDVPATSFTTVYGGTVHYGGAYYYGTQADTLSRQRFKVPGASNDFQIEIEVEDTDDWTINEVGVRSEETN